MKRARLSVIAEDPKTDRNTGFKDNKTGERLTIKQTISRVENGMYPEYYVNNRNSVKYVASKPDKNYPNLD